MATTVFIRSTAAAAGNNRTYWGADTVGDSSSLPTEGQLTTARGTVATQIGSAGTLTGPQDIQFARAVSYPLAANVTIAGTISWNLWGFETNMSANASFKIQVFRLQPDGTSTSIGSAANAVELGTTSAARTGSFTPTSTAFKAGDCIGIVISTVDAGGTMGNAFQVTAMVEGPTGAADGDSFLTFTEALTFSTTAPGGTSLHFTDTASDINPGANIEKALQIGGSAPGAFTKVTNTVAGPISPLQMTDSAGGTAIEWYSPQLSAATLSAGLMELSLDMFESVATTQAAFLCQIYIADSTGVSTTLIAKYWGNGNTDATANEMTANSADAAVVYSIPVAQTTINAGDRIKVVLYLDDSLNGGSFSGFGGAGNSGGLVTGRSITLQLGTAGYLKLPITVSALPGVVLYAPQLIPRKRVQLARQRTAVLAPPNIIFVPPPVRFPLNTKPRIVRPTLRRSTAESVQVDIPSSRPVLWSLQVPKLKRFAPYRRTTEITPPFAIAPVAPAVIFAPPSVRKPFVKRRRIGATHAINQGNLIPSWMTPNIRKPFVKRRRIGVTRAFVVPIEDPTSRPVLWALQLPKQRDKTRVVRREPFVPGFDVQVAAPQATFVPPLLRKAVARPRIVARTTQPTFDFTAQVILTSLRKSSKAPRIVPRVVQPTFDIPSSRPVLWSLQLPKRSVVTSKARSRVAPLPVNTLTYVTPLVRERIYRGVQARKNVTLGIPDVQVATPVVFSPTLPTRKTRVISRRAQVVNLAVDIAASRPVLWSLQLPKVNKTVLARRRSTAIKADIYIVTIPPPQGAFVPYLPKVNRARLLNPTRKTSFAVDIPASRPVLWAIQLPKVNRVKTSVRRSTAVKADIFIPAPVVLAPSLPKVNRVKPVSVRTRVAQPIFVVAATPVVIFVPSLLSRTRVPVRSQHKTTSTFVARPFALWMSTSKTRTSVAPRARRTAYQVPQLRTHSPQVNRTRPYRRYTQRHRLEFVSGVAFSPPPAGLNMTGQPLLLLRADPYRLVSGVNREVTMADAYRRVEGVNREVDRADSPRRVRRKHA